MKHKRIVIETTNEQKHQLDIILSNQGKSLVDWFIDKVEEEAVPYLAGPKSGNHQQLEKIEDLSDPQAVFKKLASEDWDFSESDTNYFSHNIHPYPAKYIPQIPNKLIRFLSLPGERILDPFGGSGTSALEALLLGRQVISSDLNPISAVIGRAKTRALGKSEIDLLHEFSRVIFVLANSIENIQHALEQHAGDIEPYIPAIPNIDKWFHPFVVAELGYLRWAIDNKLTDKTKTVALATFSRIVTRVSFQDGETRYVSKPRHVERGSTFLFFHNELASTIKKVAQLPTSLLYGNAHFVIADSSAQKIAEANSIDLVVTSPPYPNTTDYHLYHRFRIFWLGFNPKSLADSEIGSHLRHQRANTDITQYLAEMKGCLRQVFTCLRPGRYAVFVVGDGVYKGEQFETANLLQTIATEIGFVAAGILDRKLPEYKRSFASPARRLRQEKLLFLVKPNVFQPFTLVAPHYRLWPYEEQLRLLEIQRMSGHRDVKYEANGALNLSSLSIDTLKRLTFTREFFAPNFSSQKTWQAILENGYGSEVKSKRKDPKYVTHGLHPYKGKFYPQLAKSLGNLANLKYGQRVLDPFCGSGTVLLESYLNGLNAYGFDINPLALKIAKVKTSILTVDPALLENLLLKFIRDVRIVQYSAYLDSLFDQEVYSELQSWFPEKVLQKIMLIYTIINDVPNVVVLEFIEVCMSSIVREISHQDPKDLRIRRRKVLIQDAPVVELLEQKIMGQLDKINAFFRKRSFAPCPFGSSTVLHADCRVSAPFLEANLVQNRVDAVITSPPYATALPYIDTDRLSILLLLRKKAKDRALLERELIGAREISTGERKKLEALIKADEYGDIKSNLAISTIEKVYNLNSGAKVGFRRQNMAALLYRYYNDMSKVFTQLDSCVKENGSLFFVIGDNKTLAGDQDVEIQSGKILVEIGERQGWKLDRVLPITVTQENKINNKNGITENKIIWFRR